MTAPTVAVEWLLARAAVRTTGLLHVVSRRDSGALNPICGANPIRSTTIETATHLTDVALLCPGCGTMAASIGGTIRDGVALLLGLSAATTTTRLLELPVNDIDAADTHARRSPGHDIDAFVESVTERGVVTPLVVRRDGHGFQVIDGVRRLYAARVAGLESVPAVVRDATDDEALLDGLTANLHRADLNPIEEASAYLHALEVLGCSKAELGRRLAISRSQVSNRIRLLELPADVQARIASGDLTASQGLAILAGGQSPASDGPIAKPDAHTLAVLDQVSATLRDLLDAKVRVTTTHDNQRRITIDVPDSDLERVLLQLGVSAVA